MACSPKAVCTYNSESSGKVTWVRYEDSKSVLHVRFNALNVESLLLLRHLQHGKLRYSPRYANNGLIPLSNSLRRTLGDAT